MSGHPFAPSLDPSENYYTSTISIASGLLVRSLTQYVYDPATERMRLIPDLATNLGVPNRDYTTWRFTLRQGVRYENGNAVTPEDVRFGIERSFDRTTFPAGATYSNLYFLHGATYQGPYRTPGPYPGVRIRGNTLILKMSQPFPDMPYWASFPAISPIPPGRASKPATYKHHPLATGPYKIETYSPGRSLVLVRNPEWDPATDPGRHQYLDRLVFDFSTPIDGHVASGLLSDDGPATRTIVMENLPADDYQKLQDAAPDRLVLGTAPCTSLWYPDNRTVTDVRVRRALAFAYPYRAAWRAYGLIPGVTARGTPTGTSPGAMGGSNYGPVLGQVLSTDPARARALLRASGAMGFRIRFPYASDLPEAVRWKVAVEQALTRAGFTAVPVARSAASYGETILYNAEAKVDVRQVGWCSDWPSGGAWIPEVLGSPRSQTSSGGQNYNFAFFSRHMVDSRIDAIERLPLGTQPAAWNALERSVQRRFFPVIPLHYFGVVFARGPDVHNDVIDSVTGMPTFKDIWVG